MYLRAAIFVFASLLALPGAAVTLHVSKLGNNADGLSWESAFTTVQGALDNVPDGGGHRVLIRPDTYMEPNLFPAHRGAPGAYNVFEADTDGGGGSGSTGYAVLDASDPERGLKSVDWYSNFRASPDFSGIGWDRWILRGIYATGGDAALFWDLPPKAEPFTIVVEDCVGIGRAFGGGVGHILPRPDEPIVFRRCRLWCLDWWGDAAGAYVRAENEVMQTAPDVTFEECTLTGPDNALQAGNPGYEGYTRVAIKDCRLIAQNFSQPRGKPSTGIIYSTIKGELLHVDIEDSLLMGYQVFGAGEGEVSYSAGKNVQAYVQFEQAVPEGMYRLGHWPVEAFAMLAAPLHPAASRLQRDTWVMRDTCEVTPLVWQGRACLMECVRPGQGGVRQDYYLRLIDLDSGEELARFAEGYGLGCALVHEGTFHVFASRFEGNNWNDVTHFKSGNLRDWESGLVIAQEDTEHLFNSSVCEDAAGFVMAYESNDSSFSPFSVKFARSANLDAWEKVPEVVFAPDRYAACPTIRYADGSYYLLYLERRAPRWFFETYIARSADLQAWALSRHNPVISPSGSDEGINASDPDLFAFGGKAYLYYAVGDQRTWMNVKRAVFEGSEHEFLESWFP